LYLQRTLHRMRARGNRQQTQKSHGHCLPFHFLTSQAPPGRPKNLSIESDKYVPGYSPLCIFPPAPASEKPRRENNRALPAQAPPNRSSPMTPRPLHAKLPALPGLAHMRTPCVK
jgi:hypothetical protein